MTSQHLIRTQISKKRKNLSPQQITSHGEALYSQLLQLESFKCAQKIALYYSIDAEMDTHYLLKKLSEERKELFLPVVKNKELIFAEYVKQKLKHNQYSILEPDVNQCKPIKTSELDIILVPLVAFDKQGNRIGMGGGYYDRTLNKHQSSITLIGLAHELQLVDHCFPNSWDIKMHCVVTEKQIYKF